MRQYCVDINIFIIRLLIKYVFINLPGKYLATVWSVSNNLDYNLCDKRTEMEIPEIELILKRSQEMKGWGQDF